MNEAEHMPPDPNRHLVASNYEYGELLSKAVENVLLDHIVWNLRGVGITLSHQHTPMDLCSTDRSFRKWICC